MKVKELAPNARTLHALNPLQKPLIPSSENIYLPQDRNPPSGIYLLPGYLTPNSHYNLVLIISWGYDINQQQIPAVPPIKSASISLKCVFLLIFKHIYFISSYEPN